MVADELPPIRLLTDPVTGDQVLCAPGRSARPRRVAAEWRLTGGPCDFCAGHEHHTPPQVLAIGDGDGDGWRVRIVPNRYPALLPPAGATAEVGGFHEVLIEGPAHTRHPVELSHEQRTEVLLAACTRLGQLADEPSVRQVFLFKNVGPQAGASMEHNHTQLLGLPLVPGRLRDEAAGAERYRRRTGRCVFADLLAVAHADGRVVARAGAVQAIVPPAPRFPHEVWLLTDPPQPGLPAAEPTLAEDLARVYGQVLEALHGRVQQHIPFNLFLHAAPVDRPEALPWHFELVPRHGVHAGMEIGLELPINPVAPEHSAALLRG